MEDLRFQDRREAGRRLAGVLFGKTDPREPAVVLGIPRGGVVVAAEVSDALSFPLDIVIARKVRAPHQPELGLGAVVDGAHVTVINEELVRTVGATRDYLRREIAARGKEIDRLLGFYRRGRPALDVTGKTVIVVDDGIATGFTFRAALEGLRKHNPGRLVAAAPVAAPESLEMVKVFADEAVCLITPAAFLSVGFWYRDFSQVSDEEVEAILRRRWNPMQPASHCQPPGCSPLTTGG